MNELKPCPFCGQEPDTNEIPAHKHYLINLPPSPATMVIECFRCDYHMVGDSWLELIARWNRRADGWISVEDRLPENEKWVLIYPYSEIGLPPLGRYTKEYGWVGCVHVTHWQPLPELPETSDEFNCRQSR